MYFDDKFSDRWLKFDEFCICESLRMMYIPYGTDCNNFKWYSQPDNSLHWTFFKFEKYYYCAMVENTGQIAFATSDFFGEKEFSDWNVIRREFDFNERKTSSASKAFSYAFYVMIEGCKKFGIDELYFSGQHAALGLIYQRMVYHNKYFLDSMKQSGFVYDRTEGLKYYFKRVRDK